MTTRLTIAFALVTVFTLVNPLWAADSVKTPQILVRMRFCEAKADAPNTVKVLSEPTVITLSGREAHIKVAGEHAAKDIGAKIESGIECKLTPTLRADERVQMEIDYSFTRPVAGISDGVAVQGTCVRGVLLLTPGKARQLELSDSDGLKRWFELTAEVLPPAAEK